MLRILSPLAVTPAMLVSSTAADADPAWSSATTYALGALVTYSGRAYESLQASNTNKVPDAASSATWWLDRGASNRWAMFDRSVGSSTTHGSALTVVIAPDDIVTAVALLSAGGTTATVTVTDAAAGVVYTRTQTIGGAQAADWWEYFFGDRETIGELVFDGLPPYLGASITVTIDASGSASCGTLLLGKLHEVGPVTYGGEFGITDYSRKEADAFGNFDVVERAYARDVSYPVRIARGDARRLDALFAAIRATPCLFVGDEDTDTLGPLVAYGFYAEFRVTVAYPTEFLMTLEVKGLT